MNSAPGVIVAPGVLRAETRLLAEIEADRQAALADPERLRAPLRVIVPSGSLRDHISERIVDRAGRSVAGVVVHTITGLAHTVLQAAGEPPARGSLAFGLLVRRFAAAQPHLARDLAELSDGYASVVGAVRDLLDAGFEASLASALDERLVALRAALGAAACDRARDIVQTAARVDREMARYDLIGPGTLQRRATEHLQTDAETLLPTRAAWLYGFADLTGRSAELVAALMRYLGARLILDLPPDPTDATQTDAGAAFAQRLLERLGPIAGVEREAATPVPQASRQLRTAPGATAEARAVALALREILDDDGPQAPRPERIGVLVRDLRGYRVPLRSQLDRLGVPYSGRDRQAPPDASGRRLQAILELLRRRDRCASDRWLDAASPRAQVGAGLQSYDLRLALRALGATELGSVAVLDLEARLEGADFFPLPARRGLSSLSDDDADEAAGIPVARRRQVSAAQLQRVRGWARDLWRFLRDWPEARSAVEHLDRLRELLETQLLWDARTPGWEAAQSAISALRTELPDAFPIEFDELVHALAGKLDEASGTALGGRGGGVQVLSVMEARGRSFDRVFLLGLNRGLFPLSAAQDPIFPDRVREKLLALLPDLPIKGRSFDEERYLFAQVLSASPELTISWQHSDDDGRARPPSPLVERLRLETQTDAAQPLPETGRCPATALEHTARAALLGLPRPELGTLLRVAAEESLAQLRLPAASLPSPEALAAGRIAVLEEVDAGPKLDTLGPYFGFVGAPALAADPRGGELWVTTLENYGRCPWKTFLERFLRLEPPPDPAGALPAIDALLIGNVVHRSLEAIAEHSGAAVEGDIDARRSAAPMPWRWPEAAALDALLDAAAKAELRERGQDLPGLRRVVVTLSRPFLERAFETELQDRTAPEVLGAELRGELRLFLPVGERRLHFKADRVDRAPNGALVLTDYKAGRPISDLRTEAKRKEKLFEQLRNATRLQAAAYALAGCGRDREGYYRDDQPGVGRYLFLRPDLPEHAVEVELRGDDPDLIEALEDTVDPLLRGLEAGFFMPRLVLRNEDREPPACERCEVKEACLRGDSSARGRLLRWLEAAAERRHAGEATLVPAWESALLSMWHLGHGPPPPPESEA